MNLGGIVLGGMVDQGNKQAELGLKRGNLQYQLMQLAGQRAQATIEQAQQIVGSLPTDQDRASVTNTMAALKQDFVALSAGAGMNPQTAAMRFDSTIATTPTIQTAARLKGGAQSTQDINATPGAAYKAGTTAGATELGKSPYTPVVIPPGGSAVPASAIVGAPGGAMGSGAEPQPPATNPGAPAGATGAVNNGGVVPNAAGGLTNPNSPALINLSQGNQPAYLEDMGKAVSQFIVQKQQSVSGYQDALNSINELKPTLLNTKTGGATATTAVSDLNKFADRFGIDLNKYLPQGWQVDPNKYDVANKAITQLATAFAKSNFPTRITNNDMQIAIAATPNFGNTPQANAQLLDNLESVARLRLAEAKFYRTRAAQIQRAGSVPDFTIMDEWQQTLSQMKGISPQLKQAYASSDVQAQAAPAAAAATPPASPAAAPDITQADALRELRRRGVIK